MRDCAAVAPQVPAGHAKPVADRPVSALYLVRYVGPWKLTSLVTPSRLPSPNGGCLLCGAGGER